ncbi:ECF transporter S component [Clostridiales bacterium COT073_COT-073]|nr:ECF transporter S component [Clostridiales bacterium COT073_COT-073]
MSGLAYGKIPGKEEKMKQRSNYIFVLVFSALCLAIGIAIKSLSFFMPIGIPILKISFDGPPIRLVAVLFGPVFGGITGALADFLGFFLTNKSGNAWIPLLTITFALNMLLVGFLWGYFRRKKAKILRIQYLVVIALIFGYGIASFGLGFNQKAAVTDVSAVQEAFQLFTQNLTATGQVLAPKTGQAEILNSLQDISQKLSAANEQFSQAQLRKGLNIIESSEVKAFEADIAARTKELIKEIDDKQQQTDAGQMDETIKKAVTLSLKQAKDTIKMMDGQVKKVKEIRRQLLGSTVVMVVALLGLLIYFLNKWIAKNQEIQGVADYFFQMFLSIFIPGMFFNWVNTYILFQILFQNQKKDIFLFGFFRSAVNLIEVYYNTLAVLFLVILLHPFLKKRGIYPFGIDKQD